MVAPIYYDPQTETLMYWTPPQYFLILPGFRKSVDLPGHSPLGEPWRPTWRGRLCLSGAFTVLKDLGLRVYDRILDLGTFFLLFVGTLHRPGPSLQRRVMG